MVAALTGWAMVIVVAPLLALGLPYLLVLPKARDVELLEALDRWVRALVASMSTGRSVTDAIRMSRRTAPPVLAAEVGRLVVRLNNRWDTQDALHGFADALDSPDADGVVAALILAARRGANGASQTLDALADSIQDQLKGRRLIETERAKPYVVVRQVTIITLVTLAGMFVLSPSFFAGYATPLGQLILSVLVVAYLGSLVLLRRRAQQPPRERLLVGARSMTPVLVLLAGMLVRRRWRSSSPRCCRRAAAAAGPGTGVRRDDDARRRCRRHGGESALGAPGRLAVPALAGPAGASGNGSACGCRTSRSRSSTPTSS